MSNHLYPDDKRIHRAENVQPKFLPRYSNLSTSQVMRRGSVFVLSRFIYRFLQYFYRQSSLHCKISLYDWRQSSVLQLNHLDPDERIRHAVNVQMKFLPQ